MASIQQAVIASPRIERLRDFVVAFNDLVETASGEPGILREGSRWPKEFIGVDDWLPARHAEPSMTRCQQYLLRSDSRERFCAMSFVWGAGQKSTIHDYTVWGVSASCVGRNSSRATPVCAIGISYKKAPLFSLK